MTEPEHGLTDRVGPAEGRSRRRSLWLVYLPLAAFAVVAAVFLVQIATGNNTSELPSALLNEPVPEFDLPPLDGLAGEAGPVPGFTNETLVGEVTVVNVFASWCIPCRQEHAYVMALGQDDRFRVFGINHTDPTADALRFLDELGNPYDAVGVDPRQRVSIDWGVYGVPETFIVDRDGVIRYKLVGPITEESLRERVMPVIERLLAEAPAGG